MARTVLTATALTATGLVPAPVTPSVDGVSFRNTGRCTLMVTNGSGASINVTPVIGRQVKGLSVTSPPTAVAAGATAFFGPWDDDYEQPGGKDTMFVNFSAVTDVDVVLLEMPR